MKKSIPIILSILIVSSIKVFCQDSLKYTNTRILNLETAIYCDSITSPILFEAFDSLGYRQSVNLYYTLSDSINKRAELDTTKRSIWGKIESAIIIIADNPRNVVSTIAPFYFILLLIWFIFKFVNIFILQQNLTEPKKEEVK